MIVLIKKLINLTENTKFIIYDIQTYDLCIDLFPFSAKNRNGTPVFGSLLDLVFAAISWNVTISNDEGHL